MELRCLHAITGQSSMLRRAFPGLANTRWARRDESGLTPGIRTFSKVAVGISRADKQCRKHAITPNTFYRWKKIYGGMEVNQAREPRQLRDENGKLKKKPAELVVEVDDLRFINSKK